ncbi:hypothetical protein SAMN02745784_02215 [Tissierella praeacuta DSM 18095]|uniref:Uncharacterized protein n=1 Tax=Tissierella praeacuta DSM 18095 TaxID=1123404 RepID=A0A1M4XE70_9FIRM|nr:hypothetical protein [Tissierella praeacuta]TCU67767.1 hypothetical protein EV204_11110 [Tissierella praeacuta]SHE91929.1 hypothetical protein SAMN02745784_02215 [Tissierella praeacuta DSM 18095]SUP02209.1 Uncharacterised protein [Tissierella praeacuta]
MGDIKRSKWTKRFFICILVILILFTFRNFTWYRNKYEIKKLVNNNLDFLNECIQNGTYDKIYELEKVKDIKKWPLDDNEFFIDFYYNGYGIASNTTYIGFYYISEDKPIGFQGYPKNLNQRGKGWQWKELSGDNWYYTEKIADHWYYYESDF